MNTAKIILKEHFKDALPAVVGVFLLMIVVPTFVYYPRDFSKDYLKYIIDFYILRAAVPIVLFIGFGYFIGLCRRCIMSIFDFWKLQEVSGELTIDHFEYREFHCTNKKHYFRIYLKRYSRCFLVDAHIGPLRCLYLDERICSLRDLTKIKEELQKKHGKRYTYTALKHSKIITSITCISEPDKCWKYNGDI